MKSLRTPFILKCVWISLLSGLGVVHAQSLPAGASIAQVWVVNGVRPDHVTAHAPTDGPTDDAWLRVLRLSDPQAIALECCWRPNGPAEGSAWGPEKQTMSELKAAQRLVPSHGASDQPFVGIALAGGDAIVRRRSAQSLEVAWKDKRTTAIVRHCVAQEGMRIQIEQAGVTKTHYIPLGMDVEVPQKYRCAHDN